jgi:hypothetical protein
MYMEMVSAAQMTQAECLEMICQHRWNEAERLGQTRNNYYDCAIIAVTMM